MSGASCSIALIERAPAASKFPLFSMVINLIARAQFIPIIRIPGFPIQGSMTIPNTRALDPGTVEVTRVFFKVLNMTVGRSRQGACRRGERFGQHGHGGARLSRRGWRLGGMTLRGTVPTSTGRWGPGWLGSVFLFWGMTNYPVLLGPSCAIVRMPINHSGFHEKSQKN